MASEQRKLLEQLMGADALESGSSRKQRLDLYDPKVCKSFLVGTCIHDLFEGTKKDLGPCPLKHTEQYKVEYQVQKSRGKEFSEFDIEHERNLEKYVLETDRQIETGISRLKKTPEDIARMNQATKQLEETNTAILFSMEEIELLGKYGEISRAIYENYKLQSKRDEQESKEREIRVMSETSGFSGRQKLQVCMDCGAFLSRLDNDIRLADHFVGKMHRSHVELRKAYAEIKEKNQKRGLTTTSDKRKRSSSYKYYD